MLKKHAWPKKGDKAFAPPSEGAYFHMPSIAILDRPHADAFKTAAEIILTKCQADGDRPMNDVLLFPAAYLYRHCIELQLKVIVHVGVGMRFLNRDDVENDMKSHNICRLWNHAKKALNERWNDPNYPPLKATEAVIQEFHQSDPNGQMFRYDADKDGRAYKHEKLPSHIGARLMRETMEGVCNFLDATSSELEENLSDRLQAERDSFEGG